MSICKKKISFMIVESFRFDSVDTWYLFFFFQFYFTKIVLLKHYLLYFSFTMLVISLKKSRPSSPNLVDVCSTEHAEKFTQISLETSTQTISTDLIFSSWSGIWSWMLNPKGLVSTGIFFSVLLPIFC